ncbi:MAG: hypothetical protein JWP12_283 [Bacteroidetes bacterium]|nr:hypothetical protein [Bacteroidota bacterium]
MKNKFLFVLILLLAFTKANSQTCFSDCKQRSLAAWENLQKKGITSTDSALSCDQKITDQLKGCAFPNVQLNKLDGGTFKIEELKGNVVFVHLWFVNCATCIAEMPMINKLR